VLDAAQVPAGAVRAGHELPAPKRLVGHDLAAEADGPNRARVRAERRLDLLHGRRPVVGVERLEELRLLEAVVAADEREHERPVVLHDGHRLRRRRRVEPEVLRQRLDRLDAGRLDLLGAVEAVRGLGQARHPSSDLQVRGVIAVLARDERVLTGAGRTQEVGRLAPSHQARLGQHLVELEAAALEDPVVGLPVELEAPVEPFLVAVE
jgi:hypothetical protein